MKLTRSKKIFLVIILTVFVVLLFNSNTVFAAINTEYSGTDTVPDTALDKAMDESSLLKLLAKLIYAVGRFLEWILGIIFSLLTGTSDFPWADKIVFNAVPLLDINFINPGAGSFVANEEIQGVLQDLYTTILTLAVSFFSIVVLITSIKLVITTIASEKAKYKQAIVDWLVGFVMLFCIHYFISFVFYLNEQMVIVASKIVIEKLDNAEVVAQAQASEVVQVFLKGFDDYQKRTNKTITYNGEEVLPMLRENETILTTWITGLASNDTSKGIQEGLMKKARWFGWDTAVNLDSQLTKLGMIVKWAASENISVRDLVQIKSSIKVYQHDPLMEPVEFNQAMPTTELEKLFMDKNGNFDSQMYKDFVNGLDVGKTHEAIQSQTDDLLVLSVTGSFFSPVTNSKDEIAEDLYLLSRGSSVLGKKYKSGYFLENTSFYWTAVLDDLIVLKGASDTNSGERIENTAKKNRLISDLAIYFRYNSYNKELRDTNPTGAKNGDNIQIQNMIMYTVLVTQSLILFIAYIKRLFYVILLAMMAPIVVVFDFFQKFGK